MELTPEQKNDLVEARAKMPQGYVIVDEKQLNDIIEQKKRLTVIFLKVKPILASLSGHSDIMSAMPQLMPQVMNLQKDEQFTADIKYLIESI